MFTRRDPMNDKPPKGEVTVRVHRRQLPNGKPVYLAWVRNGEDQEPTTLIRIEPGKGTTCYPLKPEKRDGQVVH